VIFKLKKLHYNKITFYQRRTDGSPKPEKQYVFLEKINFNLNNMKNKGTGLVITIVMLFVILSAVVFLVSIAALETKMGQGTKSSIGAFYNSESGVEWALNKIASNSDTIADAFPGFDTTLKKVDCPAGIGGANTCMVYFLDEEKKVIGESSADISEIAAVRSIGSQNTGDINQWTIEAAVAAPVVPICKTQIDGIGINGNSAEAKCSDLGENYVLVTGGCDSWTSPSTVESYPKDNSWYCLQTDGSDVDTHAWCCDWSGLTP
jgi:hypothetical protein